MSLKDDLKIKMKKPKWDGQFSEWFDNEVQPEISRVNKLIDDGEIVHNCNDSEMTHWTTQKYPMDNQVALLIGKRPIEQNVCEHHDWFMSTNNIICSKCKRALKPLGFEVI